MIAEKSIRDFVEDHRATLSTPYYLLDEELLLKNLKKIAFVRERCGARSVLALKCFSTWSVFDLMSQYMDGTTSSSLYEARLGHEKFGKEVHAYSVAFTESDIQALRPFATKVIFNSVSQFNRLAPLVPQTPIGLRINPGISHSEFDLADPARSCSRLGVTDRDEALAMAGRISGAMFHCNCENDRIDKLSVILDHIAKRYEPLLHKLDWVSLGGGIYFTKDNYPLEDFCDRLSAFSRRFNVQVYLEPGEASVTRSGYFVTKVLDIVRNGMDVAIVDGAVETHMLDLLIYRTDAKIDLPPGGSHSYMVAGRTCLAGDVFGTYAFPEKLTVGSLIAFEDAAGYTNVKKNWFNGIPMPSIVVKRLDGRVDTVRHFSYEDYLASLS